MTQPPLGQSDSERDPFAFIRDAKPWWHLWLRHPIRETKWWWRYAR